MDSVTPHRLFSPTRGKQIACLFTALSLALGSGCSSVAPSKTATGAGTGAVGGAVVGGVVGNNSSVGSGTGILAGAAAGALLGGIVGLTQEMKERREQERLAQERAYMQDMARRRQQEAQMKVQRDEELAVAQGFQISDLELADAQQRDAAAQERLKRLRDEWNAALAKKKALDDAHERTLQTEAEIARMEEELARLKGEELMRPSGTTGSSSPSTLSPPGS